MTFSLDEINTTLGLIIWNNAIEEKLLFQTISIDSRTILPNDLFIAIKGDKFDGHNFLMQVINKGVKAIVIGKGFQNLVPENYPYWIVPDTLNAFQNLALLKRRKLNIPVIGITGSVGKTTTKEITGEVLRSLGKIKISPKNYNNEIGVGSTILSCDKKDKSLVLEMGMRGIGQIESLSKFSEPDIAVITNIGSAHIGLLGSKENIAKAKCEITKYLNPKGIVIIPSGDYLLESVLKSFWKGKVIRVKILNIKEINKINKSIENLIIGVYDQLNNLIKIDNKTFETPLKGQHNAMNFLYAYAISKELGIQFGSHTVLNLRMIEGRNNIIKTNKLILMDETYNASPESVKACLKVLMEFPGNHFFVFGSMKELGEDTFRFHKEIIDLINKNDIERCVFLCDNDLEIKLKKYCELRKKIEFITSFKEISLKINEWTSKGDSLLLKGSRSWQLEKLIPLIK